MAIVRKNLACVLVFISVGILCLTPSLFRILEKTSDGRVEEKCTTNEMLLKFKKNVNISSAETIMEALDNYKPALLGDKERGTIDTLAANVIKGKIMVGQKEQNDVNVVKALPIYFYKADTIIESDEDLEEKGKAKLDKMRVLTKPAAKFPTNDPQYLAQWQINKIDMDDAWEFINKRFPGKEKVKVAVLDMGTNLDHEDLKDNILRENCVEVPRISAGQLPDSESNIILKPYTKPLQYHGSLVSGVIAANSNNGKGIMGMTNNLVDLMSINVFRYRKGADDSERLALSKDIAKCIEYAVNSGAKVINMSIGNSYGSQSKVPEDTALEKAINWAVKEKNVTIVCSAGNKNSATYPWFPSDYESTISVISTDNYDSAFSKCKSSFSNYGKKKTLSAPGRSIVTTNWNKNDCTYSKVSGTSLASPVVASVAALMYYVNPDITAAEVKNILCKTATDLYTGGWDAYTGYGNVNAFAAVAEAAGEKVYRKTISLNIPKIMTVTSAGLGRLAIKWKPITGAGGYYIYRSTSANGLYSYIGSVKKGSKTTLYIDQNLKYRKRYYYKVKAIGTIDNKKCFSQLSGAKSNYPIGKITSFQVKNSTYKSVKLSWDKVPDAVGYKIYRSKTKQGKYIVVKKITKATTTSWEDKSLRPGQQYYYKIRAYKAGATGPVSTCKAIRAEPLKVTLAISKYGKKALKLKWKKVLSVSGFKVYKATAKAGKYKLIAVKKSTARSYIDYSARKNKFYYYKVKAYKTVKGKIVYGKASAIRKIKL